MATTISPLIKNGKFVLTETGDLQFAPDIKTQVAVAISGYNCMYGDNLNSNLIPYLTGIPVGGFQRNVITNIVISAYKPLIVANVISRPEVAVKFLGISTVTINVSVLDNNGNSAKLSWDNLE